MEIEHIAIWCKDIEKLKAFYETYFLAEASKKYINSAKNFCSYFLTFTKGARLELMHHPDIEKRDEMDKKMYFGYTHLAISVGSTIKVDEITKRLGLDGYTIVGGPRYTGDGYYESVILDPDGNQIEITI